MENNIEIDEYVMWSRGERRGVTGEPLKKLYREVLQTFDKGKKKVV